jgi:hypothetical protein
MIADAAGTSCRVLIEGPPSPFFLSRAARAVGLLANVLPHIMNIPGREPNSIATLIPNPQIPSGAI